MDRPTHDLSTRHPRLHLHIGLPKTATTFLQHRILRRLSEVHLVHRSLDDRTAALVAGLKRYLGHGDQRAPSSDELTRLLGEASNSYTQPSTSSEPEGPKPLVVSDENLSLSARGIWEGTGPGPDQVAERLRSFVEHLRPSRGWARVIVGIRRQDHWLASRYAQSARQFPAFSQEDFEQRVRDMTEGPTPEPQRWLSYAEVHRRFAEAFGPENLLFLPMEGLTDEPERWLGRLGDFLDSDDVLRTYQASLEEGSSRRNARSVGNDRWVLGNDGGTIELTEETSALVLDRFRADNDRFAEQVDLDVAALGYHA